LFIDAANCRHLDFKGMLRAARRYGELVVVQAYGNFANWRDVGRAAEQLFLLGVRLIHCPGWRNGSGEWKSAPDELLMHDVRSLLHQRPDLARFILGSGDGHFVPTLCEIKKQGREAIVMADEGVTSRLVIEAADRFVPVELSTNPVPEEVYLALEKSVRSLQNAQGKRAACAGRVKAEMIKLLGGFDETEYRDGRDRPFGQFSDFLREAASEGWVRLFSQGNDLLVQQTAHAGRSRAA
jgi:hypothetical protein